MTPRTGFRHVPALDGIRALSLVAILVFHSDLRWAQGGFLGVTVFFTLSGFLISSLLLSERERTGGIVLRSFWARRARRLAPAVLVLLALVVVLVAADAVTGSRSITYDALATAGWVANWRFILSGQTYGDLFNQPTPFQHMWSLAIEEQFYLLFPGALLLLLGRGERLRRGRAAAAVLAVTAGSLATAALLAHPGEVARAYYGTDSRIAEPLVGVLLALLLTRGSGVRVLPQAARRLLDAAGLGAVVGLVVLAHQLNQYSVGLYHGWLLTVALLSAVLIAAVTQPGSLLGRALAAPPLVLLGRLSYGGYVFHWPVYLWLTAQRTGLDGWRLLLLRVTVTLLIAGLSYVLIEEPVRYGRRVRMSIAVPLGANTAVLTVAALAFASGVVPFPSISWPHVPTTQAVAAPPAVHRAPAARAGSAARPATLIGPRQSAAGPGAQQVAPQVAGPTARPSPRTTAPKPYRIAVIGDSLADDLGRGLRMWSSSLSNVGVLDIAWSGCPIARGGMRRWPDGFELRTRDECAWWADPESDRMKRLNAFDPQVIIIQDAMNELVERKLDDWPNYRRTGDPTFDTWMIGEYQIALTALNPRGDRSVLQLNAVCADWNRVSHFQGFAPELSSRVTSLNIDYDNLHQQTDVPIIDLRSHLCPNGQYKDTVDGVDNARPDGYHLTDEASLAVAREWLGPICLGAVSRS